MSTTTATEVQNHAYEGMFLLDSNKYASNPNGVTQEVLGIIEKAGGTLLASRPWQDTKLAYPINGHRKGLYFLTYFRLPGEGLTSINRSCKLSETVLRHLVLQVDPVLVETLVARATGEGGAFTNFTDEGGDSIEGEGDDRSDRRRRSS